MSIFGQEQAGEEEKTAETSQGDRLERGAVTERLEPKQVGIDVRTDLGQGVGQEQKHHTDEEEETAAHLFVIVRNLG